MDEYGHSARFPTRWNDNDQYGHINNAVYYEAMDTTINKWMMAQGALDVETGSHIGVCASSSCQYRASGSFPDDLVVGLRAGRVGTTSVTWETGIFSADGTQLLAEGTFVHVFVDRENRRPSPLPVELRAAIEDNLVVKTSQGSQA